MHLSCFNQLKNEYCEFHTKEYNTAFFEFTENGRRIHLGGIKVFCLF